MKSLKKRKNRTKLVLNSFYTEKLKGSSTVYTIYVVQFMTIGHKKSVTATDCFLSVVPTKGDATSLQHSLHSVLPSQIEGRNFLLQKIQYWIGIIRKITRRGRTICIHQQLCIAVTRTGIVGPCQYKYTWWIIFKIPVLLIGILEKFINVII